MKIAVILLGVSLFLGLSSFKNKTNNNENLDIKLDSNSISGLIVDKKTGETLVGVEVKLQGTNLKTYTNFDGKFSFDNVTPGKYQISTNLISYKATTTKEINVKKNELHALNFELKQVDTK